MADASNSRQSAELPRLQVLLRARPLIGIELEHGDEATKFQISDTTTGRFKIKVGGNAKKKDVKNVKTNGGEPLSPRSQMVLKMSKRRKKGEHAYSKGKFHGIFLKDASNENIYENGCAGLVSYAISGNIAMMFAYGNTGSGKTHTMLGSASEKGMYYMAAADLCQCVQEANNAYPDLKLSIRVQFAELHQNKAHDLLDNRVECYLRENEQKEFVFRRNAEKSDRKWGHVHQRGRGLKNVYCTTVEEIESAVKEGIDNRASGHSTFHKQSSRSHAVLQMEIVSEEIVEAEKKLEEARDDWIAICNQQTDLLPNLFALKPGKPIKYKKGTDAYEAIPWMTTEISKMKFNKLTDAFHFTHSQWKKYLKKIISETQHAGGKIVLIDLAGSEHGSDASRDLEQTAQEKREGKKINLSLLALNEVFRMKAAKKKAKYRESTLTKVLRDYLENEKSKCLMLANISSSHSREKQTISTLNYAALLAK